MVVKNYADKPVDAYDLFTSTIFYLLHGNGSNHYLKNYPEVVEDARDFFLREYESWELRDEYSFEMFLKIQREFKGLFWKFKKAVADKHLKN